MKQMRVGMALLVGLVLIPAAGWAKGAQPARRAKPAGIDVVDLTQFLDVNRISMIVSNTGSFAYDFANNAAGLEFPKGSANTAVYAAGLWLGGKVGGQTRVAVVDYLSEYAPGIILPGGAPDNPNRPEYVVYKLNRADSAGIGVYNYGAVPYGAPPVTVNGDGTLNILGDQMLWSVFNDANASDHINQAGQTAPLGVEVQQTLFAFNRTGTLGQTLFVKYRIINKSTSPIDSMYVSQWADPDLGNYLDDLVGCDVSRSLGYVYNADNNDDGYYGSTPPAVGFDFFKGPKGYAGTELGMTSFNKYTNGTDPDDFNKTYNYMKGLQPDGSALVDPTTNQVTTYFVNGDPVSATGWLDTNAGDRRLMLSSGPFPMAVGDTQEVVVGIVIGEGSNRLASITKLRCGDADAQSAFDQNFVLAPTPNQPVVTSTQRPGDIFLSWDTSSEAYSNPSYTWEGYVVYQGASATGPFQRVATYDIEDGITTILEPTCDETSGQILDQVRILANDSGLRYSIALNRDLFRGGPLRVGSPYYFAVTAYAVGLSQTPKVLETPLNVLTLVPQTPPGGVDWSTAKVVSPPTAMQVVPSPNLPTTDQVTVNVLDPDKVLSATYRIGYKPDASGVLVWYMVRDMGSPVVTDTVINNWSNYSGDENYPVVDGIQVKVVGQPLGHIGNVVYTPVGSNPPGLDGFGGALGFQFFNDGADYVQTIEAILGVTSAYGPADTSHFDNVEIRFGPPGQNAYRYMGSTAIPRTYLFQDYVPANFQAWDIDRNRQLNIAFMEFEPATPNGVWDPDADPDPFARREFLMVYESSYSGATPDPLYTTTYPDARNDGANIDFTYALWPRQATDAAGNPLPIVDGDKVSFSISTRTVNDYITFTMSGPNRFNADVAKDELSRVLAVPNPYFAHSRYEPDQFNRVVKFTHLPAQCTVRIFTLAGDKVRTLQKNDATSQLSWDLKTEAALPVGSGIYIFHVDAPGVGTKIGKLVLFLEKERLNNF